VAELEESLSASAQLDEQAVELRRSNTELEQFAYVASHDLQEPLRKVQAFGDRLKGTCAKALGTEGRDYLDRMQTAAKRMQVLIEDLLVFSRVTTKASPFQPVDLGRIVREVLSDLEVRMQQSGGQVEVQALPTVDADPIQMRQLFQNLIGNALKFHQEDQKPKVRIRCQLPGPKTDGSVEEQNDGLCRIEVEDNGIGFDEKHLDRIFVPFQRLHGRSTYEGTGIGLAICRKIVDRHSGQITAHSTPGKGSMFVVTLPLHQKQRPAA
jgi:light-regulated signal transduction histidine kinase (bacteriophytochrome)